MKTWLQILRVVFWMTPVQRWLTVIGALMLVSGLHSFWGYRGNGSWVLTVVGVVGTAIMLSMLAGSVSFRMLSASRALLLRPHARARLLASAISVLLLIALAFVAVDWIANRQWTPPRYRPDAEYYLLQFSTLFSFGTLAAITLFIASRSPLCTLLILLIWLMPSLLLQAFGLTDSPAMRRGPVSIASCVVAWTLFGAWYMRTRRIHASSWGRRGDSAAVQPVPGSLQPATRDEAMKSWILAGARPLQLGAWCLLAALALLGFQWLMGREVDSAEPLRATMLGTLACLAVLVGAVSGGMAVRARSLWLASGRTRPDLHLWVERQMLMALLAIFVAVAMVGGLVWVLVRPSAALSPAYLLAALLAPGSCAAWLGLMQAHRRSLLDILAVAAIVGGIFYAVVGPFYSDRPVARWYLVIGLYVLALVLREVGRARWRGADWRRA